MVPRLFGSGVASLALMGGCRLYGDYAFDTGEPTTVRVTGFVRDLLVADQVLEGVEVCADGADLPCDETDADGAYAIELPVGESAITFLRDDYKPGIQFVRAPEGGRDLFVDYPIIRRQDVGLFMALVGADLDDTAPVIAVDMVEDPADPDSGPTLALAPASSSTVGPVYFDENRFPAPGLTQAVGLTVWAGMPEGDTEIRIQWADGACERSTQAWSAEADDTTRMEVRADYVASTFAFRCAANAR